MCGVFVINLSCFVFFFLKQNTAYEMRISDWSSDVCSSDLSGVYAFHDAVQRQDHEGQQNVRHGNHGGKAGVQHFKRAAGKPYAIGRASCGERVSTYV